MYVEVSFPKKCILGSKISKSISKRFSPLCQRVESSILESHGLSTFLGHVIPHEAENENSEIITSALRIDSTIPDHSSFLQLEDTVSFDRFIVYILDFPGIFGKTFRLFSLCHFFGKWKTFGTLSKTKGNIS